MCLCWPYSPSPRYCWLHAELTTWKKSKEARGTPPRIQQSPGSATSQAPVKMLDFSVPSEGCGAARSRATCSLLCLCLASLLEGEHAAPEQSEISTLVFFPFFSP